LQSPDRKPVPSVYDYGLAAILVYPHPIIRVDSVKVGHEHVKVASSWPMCSRNEPSRSKSLCELKVRFFVDVDCEPTFNLDNRFPSEEAMSCRLESGTIHRVEAACLTPRWLEVLAPRSSLGLMIDGLKTRNSVRPKKRVITARREDGIRLTSRHQFYSLG
jgi:hypothetical protein